MPHPDQPQRRERHQMYVPHHFKEDDPQMLRRFIREHGFGVLVLADGEGIEANHVPFLLHAGDDGSPGTLQCHLARANTAWQRIENAGRVLAIFQGPDAYVTPSWYPTKAETGQVVPTWNYLAVHVEGRARVVEDPAWLKEHLRRLTVRHEAGRERPWSLDDAPERFTGRLLQAIVGIEIPIETLTGKWKASQNQPERNRAGVKEGLALEGSDKARALSELIDRTY